MKRIAELFTAYELFVSWRYLRAQRKEVFISFITAISISGVALGVMALIIVLAVMTGLIGGLRDKILGTNSHILIFYRGGMMQEYRSKYPSLFIAVPWDEDDVGGCLSAGRGFVHINATGDLEPCPFAPFSDTNVRENTLKDALQSKLCAKIRQIPELSREKGGGCVLWKERELVQSLFESKDISSP